MKIADIQPNPNNPRLIKDERFERLKANIKKYPKFLEKRPIVIDSLKNPIILGGNMRYRALKDLGYKEIPDAWVKSAEDLTEDEKRAFIIIDNVEFGESDWEKLANEWDETELKEWGLELKHDFGKEATEDDYEIPDEIQTDIVRGDLFEIGQHRLLCGDSTNAADVAKVMDGQIANIFSTDPPYGVALNDETGSGKKSKIENDENDGKKLQQLLESVFGAWLPHLDIKAAWYLWHAQMTQGFFAAAAAAANIIIHRQIIWVKPSLIMGHGDYHWRHELCFYGWSKGNRPNWYADRKQDTVWEVERQTDKNHPTRKPVEIFARPLRHNTLPNCIAAEPFAGSGSQYVACHELNRKCYGIEIEPKYCQIIIERMLKLDPALEIKRSGKLYSLQDKETEIKQKQNAVC